LSQREITMTGKSIEGFSWGVPSANSGNVICIRRWMTFRWWNWDSGWISSILNTNLLTNFLSYKWRRYEPGQPFLFAVVFSPSVIDWPSGTYQQTAWNHHRNNIDVYPTWWQHTATNTMYIYSWIPYVTGF
jgi:hypothetical protein